MLLNVESVRCNRYINVVNFHCSVVRQPGGFHLSSHPLPELQSHRRRLLHQPEKGNILELQTMSWRDLVGQLASVEGKELLVP